ncbi:MAG TPA: PAS domain S-box protein [Bacteroides sp.]|nr:PAS domain S-box protein [Bacteroides sp.]
MSGKNQKLPRELISPSVDFIAASERIGLHWWYWNTREHRLTVSPGLLSVLGYTEKDFDPTEPSIYKNIHPDDASENLGKFKRLLNGETNLYEMEYRVRNRQGVWEWYYNRGSVIEYDPEGRPLIVGGISMNISDRFTYLLSMLEEKHKFEFVFQHSNEAIMVIEILNGRADRVVDANEAAAALFEKDRAKLIGKIPPAYDGDEMIGISGSVVRELQETGFVRFEKEVMLAGKRRLWLEFTAYSFDLTGEDLVLAIVKDITSGKMTEAALRESEKLYRILFEAADDRIALLSREGKFILVNSAFHQSIGYTRDEFLQIDRKAVLHPDDTELISRMHLELLSKGISSYEYRIRHRDGHWLQMSSKNVLIPGETGEQDLILSITRDVTEQKKTLDELEIAKQRAEESHRLKSAFLANMSHEIRTPMNSIVGFSYLLVNPDLDEPTREEYVHRIIRNSETLLALISDIIDLARIESGQLALIYERLDLSTWMEELQQYALDELRRLKRSDLDIILEKGPDPLEMDTDMVRLTQVMKNLINNAIKFTQKGQVKIGYRSMNEEKVFIFVEDTGIGIDPGHFELIFEQFRQIDESNTRRFGGTGLGLSISRNLVEMMGGRIGIKSQPGKGSLFQVELPVKGPVHIRH